jgi:hypothetical protein
VMNNYFDFLIKQSAVEERRIEGDRIVYAITERGLYLIKCFNELNLVIPTEKIGSEIPSIQAKNQPTGMSTTNTINSHRSAINF